MSIIIFVIVLPEVSILLIKVRIPALFFREAFVILGRLVGGGRVAASTRRSRPTSTPEDAG